MHRTYLLPENGTYFKANMHCHTTFSDGRMTPEQVKIEYKKRGYSIVAFTDHEYLASHNELTDDAFLALTGYEISVDKTSDDIVEKQKTYHLNFYAKNPNQEYHVCFHPKYVWCGDKSKISNLKYIGELFERNYSVECVNQMIAEANKNGFLVSYNHPAWSGQRGCDYLGLRGLTAAEIYNHSSEGGYNFGYGEEAYASFCDNGIEVGCFATDDNHNSLTNDYDSILCDSFGGRTYFKAEKLSYDSIMEAFEKKNFYASTGVELYDLYMEDDTLTVNCSACCKVFVIAGGRILYKKLSATDDITGAQFTINRKNAKYLRVICVNTKNQKAYSNAYFHF
jgi:Predicted metal-dependent phosphoesterases (PHP family)